MSAKSRKRNKRLLALAGLAGAVAMSNRKAKSDLASTEDGKSAKADRGFTMADVANTPKKDKKNIPQTTKVNTERKRSQAEDSDYKGPGIKRYDDGSIIAKDKGSGNMVSYANKEKYSTRKDTKPPGASGGTSKPLSFIDSSKSSFAQNQAKQGLRSGGRAGLKSGGKVKGCGIAKRGLGRAMKGKR